MLTYASRQSSLHVHGPSPNRPTIMSIAETRRPQIFPELKPTEIERLHRFGHVMHFADGGALFRIGEPGHGLFVVLAGKVALFRNDHTGGRRQFHVAEAGAILGELSQLS